MKASVLSILTSILMMVSVFSCKTAPQEYILFERGKTTPILVLPSKPKGIETKAATMFLNEFKAVTGISLKIIAESDYKPNAAIPAVFIGNTNASVKFKARYTGLYDGFAFGQKENNVFITSNKGLGLLNAISAFFEEYTKTLYIDTNEKITHQTDIIKTIGDDVLQFEPAFAYRQAYFPQSSDYDYAIWNRLHLLEEQWAIWGHNLHKLIKPESLNPIQRNSIYALINGSRNEEQYCFSSDELASLLITRIEEYQISHPDATYYSITPNDNMMVCSCDKCNSINKGTKSSTNSVAMLINKVAKHFPDLMFTTLAYQTTINPPSSIKYNKNVIIILSTIDYPKGQPLAKSKQAIKFKNWVTSWKNTCQEIYVWDYAIQYTNYFDFFPNLKSLQQDLQLFKEVGITGVLEQGSENNYCLFDEMRSYVIAKLLWDPTLDVEKLRYDFIEQTYPSQVDFLTDFLTIIEKDLAKSGKPLNIYGSIYESMHSYVSPEQYDLFFYDLLEKFPDTADKEKFRLQKVIAGMIFNKLEQARASGIEPYGYADPNGNDSVTMHTEVNVLLKRLKDYSSQGNITVSNEIGDSISTYINNWNKYIIARNKRSKLLYKSIHITSSPNGEYNGDATKALNDACYGFLDYEVNWLLFNNTNLEVEIKGNDIVSASNISMTFLHDPRHFIFLPSKVEVFSIASDGSKTKLGEQILTDKGAGTKQIVPVIISTRSILASEKIKIIATNPLTLPPYAAGSARKPSIACDELSIY